MMLTCRVYFFQGELEHRTPKNRFVRTSGKAFVMQMTRIERREARIRRIRAKLFKGMKHGNEALVPPAPEAHHHIGTSQNSYQHIGSFLRDHSGDPAIKVSTYTHKNISTPDLDFAGLLTKAQAPHTAAFTVQGQGYS